MTVKQFFICKCACVTNTMPFEHRQTGYVCVCVCVCVCVRVHFCNIIGLTCPLGGFYTFYTPDELSEICTSHNLTLFGYFCTVKLSVWCATVFLCKMQDSARGDWVDGGAHNIFPSSSSPVTPWAPVTLCQAITAL